MSLDSRSILDNSLCTETIAVEHSGIGLVVHVREYSASSSICRRSISLLLDASIFFLISSWLICFPPPPYSLQVYLPVLKLLVGVKVQLIPVAVQCQLIIHPVRQLRAGKCFPVLQGFAAPDNVDVVFSKLHHVSGVKVTVGILEDSLFHKPEKRYVSHVICLLSW